MVYIEYYNLHLYIQYIIRTLPIVPISLNYVYEHPPTISNNCKLSINSKKSVYHLHNTTLK